MEKGRDHTTGFTIDGQHSRDLDDAIWLREAPEGYIVDIAIADVAHSIPAGGEVDRDALRKAFTRYHATGNDPMVPRTISEGSASLLPGEERMATTISIPFDRAGNPGAPTMAKTITRSIRRYSYQQADDMISADEGFANFQMVTLNSLAQALLQRRRKQGALAIYDIMMGWATDEDGHIYRLTAEKKHYSNIIVQEFMILANACMANYLIERGAPALFRNHTATMYAPDRQELARDLESIGPGTDPSRLETLRKRLTMVLNRAAYSPTLQGHYGLNLPAYVHFTSPIRRYADLVNNRIVSAILEGNPPPYTKDDLEGIAQHLNQQWNDALDKRHSAYVARAKAAIQRKSSNRGLSSLDPDDFHKVVKYASRENAHSADLETEIRERLKAGRMQERDLYHVLLVAPDSTDWNNLKAEAVSWLRHHAQCAQGILNIANQEQGLPLPTYDTTPTGPDHDRTFMSTARTELLRTRTHKGRTKKHAEQLAALDLITQMALLKEAEPTTTPQATEEAPAAATPNWKGRVLELCQKRRWQPPQFATVQRGPHFESTATIHAEGREYTSTGPACTTKKEAEHEAARVLYGRLPKGQATKAATANNTNYVGRLAELCTKRHLAPPLYTEKAPINSQPAQFAIACSVALDNAAIEGTGTASTKKEAKKQAARQAYERLFAAIGPR